MMEIIDNRESLKELAPEWNNLANISGSPLLRHEWFSSCAEALHDEKDLCIVVIRSGNDVAAIAPMVFSEFNGGLRLELIGVSFLHEPCGLLYDSEDSLNELLESILKLRYPVLLQRIPSDSLVSKNMRSLSKRKGASFGKETAMSAYVSLNTGWNEYFQTLSSRRRYDFRRARKKTAESGEVFIEIFQPDPDELENHLDSAFRVEAAGWKGRKGSALLYNKKLQKFFRLYAKAACSEGIFRLCFLRVDNKVIAVQICLEYADCFWVLKIGYDEAWAKYSPGMQLTMESVKYSIERGLKSYEFLGSDEPWLKIWANDYHSYSSFLFYPFSMRGLIGFGRDAQSFLIKKARKG